MCIFIVVSGSDIIVASILNIINDYLQHYYKHNRFTAKGAEWPPNQAKIVVSVALIHNKGKRTQQELFEIVNIHKEGAPAVDNLLSSTCQKPSTKKPRLDYYSRVTKSINDIFAADPTDLTRAGTSSTETPKRILIEGAPGIGKTVLAKETAYRWATNEILTKIKIFFLLYLRDPQLQSITTTKQLVEYMSMGCLDNEQIATFNKYLVNTKGQQLCIVMDGFDEYPTLLQMDSFIVDIINGVVFSEAIVVITSRPTATVSLHDWVDRRIDILGLPKEEREKYISEIFTKSPKKKNELDKYLKQQPIINGLCFVPLHLTILLYLFQQDNLPKTLTEMNESFILHTIFRHLKRHKLTPSGSIDKLVKLPKKVLDIVYNLTELAFKGLQENKLVFTFDEIKQSCPDIDETVGAINGFGLLQAVEHYPHKGAGTTKSFNFLHYTMQEFLAALHVSSLPSEQQSSLMEKTFWDGHYNFMWMMFVGIVGIKSDIFINFISKREVYNRTGRVTIDNNIQNDKRKLLHVFQCYLEAKENIEIPDVISSMFKDGKVIFSEVKLFPHNITSLMSFMSTKQSVQWKLLKLQECNIGDIGMSVLQQFISENTSTLEYVDFSDNESSPWGVYSAIIRNCSANSLTLCGGDGIEDYVNEIKEALQTNTTLISLTLCNIINDGVISIAEAIEGNTTLQNLDISSNNISDAGAAAISDSLKRNSSLVKINMKSNKITGEGAKKIAEAIQINSTLQNINLSKNHISIEGLLYFMEAVKNNYTLQVVNITHNNVTKSGFTSIKQCIENLPHEIQIYASWNEINKNGKLVSKIYVSCAPGNTVENVWSFNEYDPDHLVVCLSECLKEENTLQELNLQWNQITCDGAKKIGEAIQVNTTLQKLGISGNMISDDGAAAISDGLKNNNSLQVLNMSGNNITSQGAKKIGEAIQVNTTLQKLDISNNTISDDGAAAISDGLKNNNTLQALNMSGNNITSEGAKKIGEAIQVNKTLHTLHLVQHNINDALSFNMTILTAMYHNNTLMKLSLPSVYVHGGDKRLVSSEVEKINKERIRQGISTLNCDQYQFMVIAYSHKQLIK